MNEEPIPFHSKSANGASRHEDYLDDAVEVSLEPVAPEASTGRLTKQLPAAPATDALGEVLALPLQLLPRESREHFRNAGREASLAAAELGASVLKGLALALNVAGESLKGYSERQSRISDIGSARTRRKVDIEVE